MTTTGNQKKRTDWESVERDYRLGLMTIREMASAHSVDASSITRRAKKEAWTRDLSEQVRAITKAKVSAAITERAHATHTARTQADFQAVEVEAVSNALLIAEHERFGTKARVLFENVLDVIADQISNMPMLEKLVALVESADGEANTSLRKATSLPMMVDAAKKAIEGGTKAADMERKARNLDDAPGPEATYEDRLRRLAESMPEV